MNVTPTETTRIDGTAAIATDPMPRPVVARPEPAPDDAWMLRRLRVVVRRRVRVDVAATAPTAWIASDGDLVIALETVRASDPRILAWRSNREVALVVIHDGCGARAVGSGGTNGRIELPGALGTDAFLAFCYDTEPGPASL
jgi:hypothetical protein